MLIEEKLEFEGDPKAVWERLSSVERIPEFWHGTRSLQILEKKTDSNGNGTARARARFAFGGAGDVEIRVDQAGMSVTWDYLSGPFKGSQTARVVGRTIEARWDVSFGGVFRLTAGLTAGHFKTGTKHALERLCAKDAPTQATTHA